jgi:hypothetical protein
MDPIHTQLKLIHTQVCKLQISVYRSFLGYKDRAKPLFPVEKRTVLYEIEQAVKDLETLQSSLAKLYTQLLKETENEF